MANTILLLNFPLNELTTVSFAIAILNYNGAELLERFLPSVLAYSGEAKIYVIDNGSTDASKQLLAEKFSER
jgi:GT2 family glycosyltransferase